MGQALKIENWNGHSIRFVLNNEEWWAVLKDVTDALELGTREVSRRLEDDVLSKHLVMDSVGRNQEMLIVNEFGIYEAVFESRKKEAKEFKKWVYTMIKELRQATGLEGFQVFRMLDKQHQREAMSKLNSSLKAPVRVDFIKANTIANKAVSNVFGHKKMIKKGDMSPNMLVKRQEILDNTTELMAVKDKFGMNISVSNMVYSKYAN